MNAEKIHLWLLNYLPVIGYAVYGLMSDFENKIFFKILITGWIVMVVYQTIVTTVYTKPNSVFFAIASLLITPLLLFFSAYFGDKNYAIIFIEIAAVGLLGIVFALIYAFIYKGVKEGMPKEMIAPVLITTTLFVTAGYFLIKLFLLFFESQNYNLFTIIVICLAVANTTFFFATRLADLTNKMGNKGGADTKPKKEFSAKGILITIFIWIVLVPVGIWVKTLIVN